MKKNQAKTVVKTEDNSMILPVEMRMRSLGDGEKHLATLNANIGGAFAVRGIRLMNGKDGPFLSFPSYKGQSGYVDICFPVTSELRQRMTGMAADAYRQALSQHQAQDRNHEAEQPAQGDAGMEPEIEPGEEADPEMYEESQMGMQM